jgi:hypothetical protein
VDASKYVALLYKHVASLEIFILSRVPTRNWAFSLRMSDVLVDASKYVALLYKHVASLEIFILSRVPTRNWAFSFCNDLLIRFCAFVTA